MTQEKALSILKSGRNVFLTGSAGTGKTYVLNQYIKYLKDRDVKVAVTASTGIAATHLNGMTIHAWSGIGVKDRMSISHLQNLMKKKYMRDKMYEVQVLIIDEISMLHKRQLDMVDEVLQFFKQNNWPFGGVQIVFSGDFFQLPPVGNQMETSRDKFCFMSNAWVRSSLKVCYLTEQYRQTNNSLNQLLNEIRLGEISQSSMDLVNEKIMDSRFDDSQRFPQLYTHNADVDRINAMKLNELRGESEFFTGKTKGNKVLSEILKNNVLAPENLEVKEGADVMFVRNNYEKGFFNGTLGQVREFTEKGFPLVETLDGKWIEVEPELWQVEDESGKPIASYTQVPLRLAWAITVHKSQGMTLDQASIDLRKTFERGQGYVALSRLKDLDGMTLYGINPTAMELDELAHKADRRFRELSSEADTDLDLEVLTAEHIPFLERCGGITDLSKVKKKKTIEKKKKGKKATHIITREMLEQGKTPEQIAKERGFTLGTILGHIQKLKDMNPDLDLSMIEYDESLIEKVKKVVETLDYEKSIPLKPIFEALESEEVDYNDIRKILLIL